jgi:hypothetical protein
MPNKVYLFNSSKTIYRKRFNYDIRLRRVVIYTVARAVKKGVVEVRSLSTNMKLEIDRAFSGIFKEAKSIKQS